jgi:branched-chain amino acid transport system substrate-binding protein
MRDLTVRRTSAAVAAALTVLTGAVACGHSARSTTQSTKPTGTITLGMISPLSGPSAQTTTDARRGAQVAIDQINAAGGVHGGQKLALKVVNEPTDPAGSATAMRTFASEGVKIVFGDSLTPDCAAAAPVAENLGILDLSHGCAGSTLTGPNRPTKSFFSAAGSDAMQAYALGTALPARYPNVKNLYMVGYDYLPGHETWDYIKKSWTTKDPSIKVHNQFFVPTTQLDFRSIASTLSAAATAPKASQGLVLTTYGAGTLALLQQAQQSGLLDRFAFIATTFMYYQPAVALKGKAPRVLDSYSYVYWGAHQNDVNTKFVAAYQKLAGNAYPSDWSFQGYVAALAAAQALDKVQTIDLPSLVKALEGMTVDGPTGTFTIGADNHQFEFPVIVGDVGGDPSSPDGVKAYGITTIPGAQASAIKLG